MRQLQLHHGMLLLLITMVVTACAPGRTAVPALPPDTTVVEENKNPAIDKLLDTLEREVRAILRQQHYALSEQQRLTAAADSATLASYYMTALEETGWQPMLELENAGTPLLVYQKDNQLFIVVITDTKIAAGGSAIYTARAKR